MTEFTSVTNTEVIFVVPAEVTTCGSASSEVSVGGQTASITFSYNPAVGPSITSLLPVSASPILKSDLVITGTNFASAANTRVFLQQDGENVYELTVVSTTST